mgnify:FL=1
MSILECSRLCKHYGRVQALDGVDLTLEPGRIVGLLGPNGSGKSTLLKLACGLLTPSQGSVRVCGEKPGASANALISYLPERMAVPEWMSVKELLAFYADFYDDFQLEAARQMLDALGLASAKQIRQMSKGSREKVQLILTMSRQARLYLLDEPIGGVDPATRDYIMSTIIAHYNPEASVVISTHLIADVEKILDEVVFLQEGRVLLHDEVDALREEKGKSIEALFREVFKC